MGKQAPDVQRETPVDQMLPRAGLATEKLAGIAAANKGMAAFAERCKPNRVA